MPDRFIVVMGLGIWLRSRGISQDVQGLRLSPQHRKNKPVATPSLLPQMYLRTTLAMELGLRNGSWKAQKEAITNAEY